MEYVINKKNRLIAKAVSNASDYVATGEWLAINKAEYDKINSPKVDKKTK